MEKLIKINNSSDLETVISMIHNSELHKDLNTLEEVLKESSYSSLEKALVYTELEMKDQAESNFSLARQAGEDYFLQVVKFLNSKTMPLAISVDPFEYVSLRKNKDEVLRAVASSFIAPRLTLNSEDKLTLLKEVLKLSKIEGTIVAGQINFVQPAVNIIWEELNLPTILILDPRIQAALEYDQDIELDLSLKNGEPAWGIKPAISSAWDKIKGNIKDSFEFLASNTVMNPNFRKVATVCVVIGIAVYSQDSSAGDGALDSLDQFADVVDGKLKEVIDAKDASCDASQFSAKFVKQGSTNFETIVRIGDYQVNYDIRGFETTSMKNLTAMKPVISKVANTGCGGFTQEDIMEMIKPMSRTIAKIVTK